MIHIDWKPSKEGQISLKLQIVEYFREKIRSGEWPIGAILPSQRELAQIFDVNRSTVVSALDILRSDGILEGCGRGGTKIVTSTTPFLTLAQTKWQNYIKDGIHLPNYKTIKMINDSDPDQTMIRLSSGEASPEMFPKKYMESILKDVSKDMGHLGYEWPTGMRCLQEQLSEYLKTIGIDVSPKCILIVSGALQAFQLITMGLLQPGSTVFVEKPSYIYSLQILQTLGMRRVGIPIDENGIVGKMIPAQIRKNRASILYTIPNYQNPTGAVMSEERRKELIEICINEKLPIIEDDVYGELWIDNPPPASLKSMDVAGNVLYVGSVSKSLSPGLRIGWVVGPETVINHLADIKMQMDYGSSSLSQLVVSKWLESGLYQEHLIEMRISLKKRRDFTLQLLDYYFKNLATWNIPSGGYYVWLRIKHPISMYKVFEDAYNKKILLYPGYIFESSSNNCLRISYSYASFGQLEKGLKMLAEIVKQAIADTF